MPKGYPQSFKNTSAKPERTHLTLYRVTLADGDIYRFADYEDDIIAKIGDVDFLFQAIKGAERSRAVTRMNLEIDSMDIDIPNFTMLTEGQQKKLGEFALTGLLDNATIEIFIHDAENPSINAIAHSTWLVQNASVSTTSVKLHCQSFTAAIDKETPRTIFQELCNNELYSMWCGVSRAAFEVTTTFFGLAASFEDAFERTILTSAWTALHLSGGSVVLDGDDVEVIATASGPDKDFAGTADTGSLIYRTAPAVPFICEVDVANWTTISDVGSFHTFLMLRESTAAGSRLFGIQTNGNDTQLRWIRRNTTGGAATAGGTNTVVKTKPLRLRIWYNGTTVWLLYSQDSGATWSLINAVQMAILTLACLCDGWLTAFDATTKLGTKYDDYKEWTANVGPYDSLPEAQSVDVIRAVGAQKTDKYYDLGEITITSGKNNGLKRSVKEHDHLPSDLSRGRKYVYSEAPTSVTDPELFILTNTIEPLRDSTAGEHVRWGTAQVDPVDVTIDTGASQSMEEFVGTFEDQISIFDTTRKPTSVEVFTSPDDAVYTSRGTVLAAAATLVHGGWFQFRYTLTITPVTARYVRFRIDRVASSFTTCSELIVRTYAYQEKLILLHALPFIPEAGDGVKIAPGCDKRLSTCKNKFNNLAPAAGMGFRGFPTIPRPTDTL